MDGAADHGQSPGLGFPILETNDPASSVAFAAVRSCCSRSTYARIGGHRAFAGEVVEDLPLPAPQPASAPLPARTGCADRMYTDLAAFWEGWTKNWFLGLDSDPTKALGAALVVALMFAVPRLLLPASLVLRCPAPLSMAWWWLMALPGLAILQQLPLWLWTRTVSMCPQLLVLDGCWGFAGGCDRTCLDGEHAVAADLERSRSQLSLFWPI